MNHHHKPCPVCGVCTICDPHLHLSERGSILSELLMLFFVLFTVATCSVTYANKADKAVERYAEEVLRR